MNLKEVMDAKTEKTNILFQDDIVYLFEMPSLRLIRAWKQVGENEYDEFDLKDSRIKVAKYLAQFLNVEDFLMEFLYHKVSPTELMELVERVDKKATVTNKPKHCFTLNIGGKKGYPFTLTLVQDSDYE